MSCDQRGHGDSDHAALYSWDADARDALAVLDSTTREPVPFVGHSKGGAILTHLARGVPHRVTKLVSIDGLPSRRPAPDIADHERTRLLADEVSALARPPPPRRRSLERKPGTPEELARRRGRMNPRLSREWLLYLVSVGARHDADGWRWKIDPALRPGGFGPWRPEWTLGAAAGPLGPAARAPRLGERAHGLGHDARRSCGRFLPPEARIVTFPETGHFIHIERPREVAELVLEFLARVTQRLRHSKIELALHRLRDGNGRPLLLLHGLGERSPAAPPAILAPWPGPVFALDFTGHGESTVPRGGGYTSECLMGDADTAISELGEVTLHGRGLGAWVALLAAGARPREVRGAILADGPGLAGGGSRPDEPRDPLRRPRRAGPARPLRARRALPRRPAPGVRHGLRAARERALGPRAPAHGLRGRAPRVAARRGRGARRRRRPARRGARFLRGRLIRSASTSALRGMI